MKLAILMLALAGCGASVIGTYLPGDPYGAVTLPHGTTFKPPTGKTYRLGDTGVLLSRGQWEFTLRMLSAAQNAMTQDRSFEPNEHGGQEF